jgi:peroxiredoxin
VTAPWIFAFGSLWIVVAALALIVVGVLRRLDYLFSETQKALDAVIAQLRADGLKAGQSLGAFAALTVNGETFGRADLRGQRNVVLFVSSACAACEHLITDLERGVLPHLNERLIVVTEDRDQATRVAAANVTVLVQRDAEVAQAFNSHRTPHAFLIDEHLRVLTSASPNEWAELTEMIWATDEGGGLQPDFAAAFTS